ncbi:MAG: transglutaminase domain-containing protein [Candidatus Thermoplasmatota archaeon]|nr:transglutaminase domain-containing protein [Candidatus Thermoplasmatota archaeon]
MRLAPLVIAAMVLLSGCISWPFGSTTREGFSQSDLTVPGTHVYSFPLQNKPDDTLGITPSHPYRLSVTLSPVYVNYGGVIRIELENTGVNDLFVYNYGLELGTATSTWREDDRGLYVPSGQSRTAYFAFAAPGQPGSYANYRLSVSTMANNAGSILPYPESRWHDNGADVYTSKEFTNFSAIRVQPYNSSSSYSVSRNYYHHYDRINDLVKPHVPAILNAVGPVTAPFGTGYNIFKTCAIFDYLQENLEYCPDPEDQDVWTSPTETLRRGCGDCEDYALLYAALAASIGGTARIYITDNPPRPGHAFAAVYIGQEARARQVVEDLHAYYGTEYHVAVLEDDLGVWLVADCLSSFYLGSLPVGGGVVGPPSSDPGRQYFYNWDFTQTSRLNIIDVLRG